MIDSSNVFGQSSNSPFGSLSIFRQNNSPSNNPFDVIAFGCTSQYGSHARSATIGGTSTGLFGTPASSPVFGASSSSPAFGSSMPAVGASSIPELSVPSSSFGGSSIRVQTPVSNGFGSTSYSSPLGSSFQQPQPAFGSNLFVSSPFGALNQPAFGAPCTLTLGASSTPAFSFGSNTTFCQSTSTYECNPFGATSSSVIGGQTTTQVFGTTGFGQPSFGGQQLEGTRVTSYAKTPEADSGSGTSYATNLNSISAMPAYIEKSHEELRWKDYRLGDKGGLNYAAESSCASWFNMKNITELFSSSSHAFGHSSTNPFRSFPPSGQSTTRPAKQLVSISAMHAYNGKSHEELRWNDVRLRYQGGQATTPTFGNRGFGQPSFGGQQREGTRVTPYDQTHDSREADGCNVTQPGRKLVSISAMHVYNRKSHEELRWNDYSLKDKGGALVKAEEELMCPICLDEMGEEERKLVTCETCENSVHKDCWLAWKRSSRRRYISCVICRARWRDKT